MRKKLLLFAAFLVLGAAPAWAAGLNLGWNNCPSGTTPPYALLRTFACTSNTGTNTLVGSFVAPANVEAMSANEIVIDIQTSGTTLPEWWKMRSTFCRAGALGGNFDFTGGPFDCYDYWQGGAIGSLTQDPPGSNNRARIKGVFALPAGDTRITSVAEGTEVYSFKANISNAKTVNSTCTGCSAEACIVLNTIKLNQPPPRSTIDVSNPAQVQHAIWQAWTQPTPNDCPLITPARQKTWGSIKSLYR